ncbi:MAG: tetratricopeptide repeat protein, partial [Nitrosopumilaceae archaeon]|nr:tetratricopeptide repeat protein [Nitrosopumilaceae archaeon]
MITLISSSLISESFAEEILIAFDKSEYDTGEILTLSGTILDFSMPIVAVSIYDPDGQILSANNIELDEEGNFSKSFSLDSPFYDKPGIYTVEINYRQTSIEDFFIISGEVVPPDPILDKSIIPEIVLLTTDKAIYTDGDMVVINGLVSILESPTVLIGIYDTFGTPAGFYFGNIDENLEFSTSFLVKAGVNFKVDGEYSIKAHYAESEAITFFEYYEKIENPTDNKDSTKTNPTDNKDSTKTNPTDNKDSTKTNPT